MKINKAIKEIKNRKKISWDVMARSMSSRKDRTPKLGKDITATLCKSDDLRTKTILDMVNALGYELVVQEKRPGLRREDQIVITLGDDKDKDNDKEKIKLFPDIDIDSILSDDNTED